MNERSVTIIEKNGAYQIQNDAFGEFELLGMLEQIVFDLKRTKTEKPLKKILLDSEQPFKSNQENTETTSAVIEEPPPVDNKKSEQAKPVASERIAGVASSTATDLRTRISNATKAIRDLGGQVETIDLSKMSKEELQTELGTLTAQYKRLKNSKGK